MSNSKYQKINEEEKQKIDALITECKMFFAFSAEQFHQNKTPLQEGEKYISFGMGGYMPKSNYEKWKTESKKIADWKKAEIKKSKLEEEEILYELRNHEAFYTYELEDTHDALGGKYTIEEIRKVFNKYKEKYSD